MTRPTKPIFQAHTIERADSIGKSIFPVFAVNAPLPPGTAVPPNAAPASPPIKQPGSGEVARPSSGEGR